MARGYRRFSLADEDEIWERLRAGHAAKPTARALGWSTSGVRGYLVRCGGIRPAPRHRSPGRLSLVEREEISRGLAAGRSLRAIAAGSGRAPSTISREVAAHGGRGRYRAAPADQLAWVAGQASQGVQAGNPSCATCHRGRPAEAEVVSAADRGLAEDHLPERPGDAGVARDDLPHPVHPVPRRFTQRAHGTSADRAGDPTSGGNPAARWAWGPARDPQHLRTTRRSRRPGSPRALGRRPGLRQTHVPGGHPGRTLHAVRDAGRATRRTQSRPGRRRPRREDHHPARQRSPGP